MSLRVQLDLRTVGVNHLLRQLKLVQLHPIHSPKSYTLEPVIESPEVYRQLETELRCAP